LYKDEFIQGRIELDRLVIYPNLDNVGHFLTIFRQEPDILRETRRMWRIVVAARVSRRFQTQLLDRRAGDARRWRWDI
jgi:hypothetical protein